jgi:trigger factor
MEVQETLSEGLKREYKVVIAANELADRFNSKLSKLGQTIRLPGFRPGKVPEALLRQRYGPALASELVEEAVKETATKAIEEKGLRPALQPELLEVGKYEEGKNLEYRFAVEALPDIEPGDFRSISLERIKASVDDSDIQAGLDRLAANNPDLKPAEAGRKAEKGDVLVIDFTGTINGAAFPGGSATDHHLQLGSNSLIPGFEDQLEGASAGEKREVKVTFPADYRAKNLAGKEAVFAVTVKELKQPAKATVDDAFAQKLGAKDLADLQAQVRKQIESDYGALSRIRLKRQLLDKLASNHDFPVPHGMVEAEFANIWKEIENHKKAGTLDEADKTKSDEELRAEYRKIAERRVRLGLLLAEVGRRNKIEVSREEIGRAMVREAQRFPGQERKVLDFYQKSPDALGQLRAPLYEDKVVDFILELAKVQDRTVSGKDLVALDQADEEKPGEGRSAET